MFSRFLLKKTSFTKQFISIILCAALIWCQTSPAFANPAGVTGSTLKTWYLFDKGIYKAGVNAMDQTLTQSVGDLVDYTYYIGTDGKRVVLTDYQYEAYSDTNGKTKNRITRITDATSGKYIEYGQLVGTDGNTYGWGAQVERSRDGRMIGAYNYDEKGRLTSKDIYGMTSEEEARFEVDNSRIDAEVAALLAENTGLASNVDALIQELTGTEHELSGMSDTLQALLRSLLTVEEGQLVDYETALGQLQAQLEQYQQDAEFLGADMNRLNTENTYYAGSAPNWYNSNSIVAILSNLSFDIVCSIRGAYNQQLEPPKSFANLKNRFIALFQTSRQTLGRAVATLRENGALAAIGSGPEFEMLLDTLLSGDPSTVTNKADLYKLSNIMQQVLWYYGYSTFHYGNVGSYPPAEKNLGMKSDEPIRENFSSDSAFRSAYQQWSVDKFNGKIVKKGLIADLQKQITLLTQEKNSLKAKLELKGKLGEKEKLINEYAKRAGQAKTTTNVTSIDLEHKAIKKLPASLQAKINQKLSLGDQGDQVEFTAEETQLIGTALREVMKEMDSTLGEASDLKGEIETLEKKIANISRLALLLEERRDRVITSRVFYKTVKKDGKAEQVMDKQVNYFSFMKPNDDNDSRPVWNKEGSGGRVAKVWNYNTEGKLKSCVEYKKDYVQVACKVKVKVDDGCNQSHVEERDGVKNVLKEWTETTNYNGDEKPVTISRDGQVIGTFDYDKFGRLTASTYNDIGGMKTMTTFDTLGRAKQSITEGDFKSMQKVDGGYYEGDKRIAQGSILTTMHVRTVTDFNYNDTAQTLDITTKDDQTYKVSGGGLISTVSTSRTTGEFSFKAGDWYYQTDVTSKIDTTTKETAYMKDGEKFSTFSTTDNNSRTTSDETLATKIGWTVFEAIFGLAMLLISVAITIVTGGSALAIGAAGVAGSIALVVEVVNMWTSMAKVETIDNPPQAPVADSISNGGYAELSLRPPVEPPKAPISAAPMVNPTNTGWGMR